MNRSSCGSPDGDVLAHFNWGGAQTWAAIGEDLLTNLGVFSPVLSSSNIFQTSFSPSKLNNIGIWPKT